MATAEENIDLIITQALEIANEFTEEAGDAADDLVRESIGGWYELPNTDPQFTVTAVEPDIPEVDDQSYEYRQELAYIIDLLANQLAEFFRLYYPLADDAFDEATAWLINTITNGGTGIPAAIEDQIWQRARERVLTDGLAAEDKIAESFAAKNYSLPAGALAKQILQVRVTNQGAIGEQSTNIAVKQAEIEIENIKFAVTEARECRTMGMNAAADYIRAVASSPAAASNIVDKNSDAQAKMMSAAAQWYRVRLDRDELILKSSLGQISEETDFWTEKRNTHLGADDVKVKALASAADAYARSAAAALTALNTVASTATNSFS